MSAQQVTFVRRATVEDLVRELVTTFTRADDVMGTDGRAVTEAFSAWSRESLLDRLSVLATPSGQLLRTDTNRSAGRMRMGSPAPWSAPAAELLDEILRGAVDLNRSARLLLGWPDLTVAAQALTVPARWGSAPPGGIGPRQLLAPERVQPSRQVPAVQADVSVAGRVALRGLPGLLYRLREEAPDRRLTTGPPDRHGIARPGYIEEALQSWHRRATELTGHSVPWRRLPDVPNPDHWTHQPPRVVVESRWSGPPCADRDCAHESCERTRRRTYRIRWVQQDRAEGPTCEEPFCPHHSCRRLRSRRKALLPWLCPSCSSDSLRLDPVADRVHCLRPACGQAWATVALEDGSTDPWGDQA